MNFSAARSSSSVVTPGRILPASRSMVRTSTSPAAAMRSISSGLFLMIIRLHVLLEPQGGDHRPDVVVDIGLIPRPVDPAQQPLVVVVVDHRRGLGVVDVQAVADDVGLVVVTLDEP